MTRVKSIKTKVICRYHAKSVSKQVSSNLDHQIKIYSCSNSSAKICKKQKSRKNFFELLNGAIRGLQMGAGFRNYKSGQEISKIGAGITNWCRIYLREYSKTLMKSHNFNQWSCERPNKVKQITVTSSSSSNDAGLSYSVIFRTDFPSSPLSKVFRMSSLKFIQLKYMDNS